MKNKFNYLLDPIFIIALSAYIFNKLFILLKLPFLSSFHLYYLNDFFLVPCCLPLLLFVVHKLGHRDCAPPTFFEIAIVLIIWSFLFEFFGPNYLQWGTKDILDVVVYWCGGIIAWFFWNRRNIWILRSFKTQMNQKLFYGKSYLS